jgi:hypothetical protein
MQPDLFVSYWFFAWFILYYLFIQNPFIQTYFNPKFALSLALIENIWILFHFLSVKFSIGFKYFINICIFKLVPLYLLRNQPMNLPNDIFVLFIILFIYKIYLIVRGEPSIHDIYKKSYDYTVEGKNDKLPFVALLDRTIAFFTCKSS